jgi:ribosomal protein S18 acetylase RimI-like enzyme
MKLIIEEYDRNRHDPGDIKAILAMATGRPTLEKLAYLIDEFYASPGRAIFIAMDNGSVSGIVGIDYIHRPYGIITHIAVHPDTRKKGIASRLISHVAKILELEELEAETDQDAVDFYCACGFETREIESHYTGIRRFRCRKSTVDISN